MHYSRACALIDRNAFESNLKKIASGLKENTKIICVVKTNAYGHGAFMISEIAEMNDHVWGFAVATADEARELRDFGRKKEILILSHTFHDDYESMITNDVIMTVFNYDTALAIAETAIRLGKKARVHLKLDTGMSRIGFRPSKESLEEIGKVLSLKQLSVEGIFTHFAVSDENDQESKQYTSKQFTLFKNVINELKKHKIVFEIKHCANTGATLRNKDMQLDMVRPGLLLYGYGDDDNKLKLKKCMSLCSRVNSIKEFDKGTDVSYGRHYTTKAKTKIAVLGIGYADGLFRALSNKCSFCCKGNKVKQLGNICMDQCMVDITGCKDINIGDEVEIFGENNSLDELSSIAKTIPYELLCAVSKRVKRIYIKH